MLILTTIFIIICCSIRDEGSNEKPKKLNGSKYFPICFQNTTKCGLFEVYVINHNYKVQLYNT